jgi:hypothetical protein
MTKYSVLAWFFVLINFPLFAQLSLDFDGEDDFIQTEYKGVFGTADRTFEAWVYITPDAPNINMAILDYGLNAFGSRNTFIVHGDGKLKYLSGGETGNIISDAGAVPYDKWTHVAFVLEAGEGRLYVNGDLVQTKTLSAIDTPLNEQTVRIGQRVDGGSIPFYGRIDEVRIWNVARSEMELNSFMSEGFCTSDENLKLYLSFEDGVAQGNNSSLITTNDLSGNGFDGVLNNFDQTGGSSNWVEGTAITNLSNSVLLEITSCESYFWEEQDILYESSGLYTYVLQEANLNGCDSIVDLDLTIEEEINVTVAVDSLMLTAEATGGENYQWIDCSTLLPIEGATGQSYEPLESGDYAVVVSGSICTDTSDCFSFIPVGTDDISHDNVLSVYPNPTTGYLAIDGIIDYSKLKISVSNLDGRFIQSHTFFENQPIEFYLNAPKGVYLLRIESDETEIIKRLIKQ